MRARGLKQFPGLQDSAKLMVAPHAGAWIETVLSGYLDGQDRESRPMRARGLKHEARENGASDESRAPCGRVD